MASLTCEVWRTVMENTTCRARHFSIKASEWKPESARTVSAPVAPARRTLATVSDTKRTAPRAGVGLPGALAHMQNLAGVRPGGEEGMVPEHPGVAVARPALAVPVDLAHRGIQIDRHGGLSRSRPGGPGPAKRCGHDLVQLADVAEGERAQEGPEGGGGHGAVRQDRLGVAGAQHVGIVDRVPAEDHRLHEGHDLAPGPGRTGSVPEVHGGVHELLEAQTLGQGRGQHDPGVGHRDVHPSRLPLVSLPQATPVCGNDTRSRVPCLTRLFTGNHHASASVTCLA